MGRKFIIILAVIITNVGSSPSGVLKYPSVCYGQRLNEECIFACNEFEHKAFCMIESVRTCICKFVFKDFEIDDDKIVVVIKLDTPKPAPIVTSKPHEELEPYTPKPTIRNGESLPVTKSVSYEDVVEPQPEPGIVKATNDLDDTITLTDKEYLPEHQNSQYQNDAPINDIEKQISQTEDDSVRSLVYKKYLDNEKYMREMVTSQTFIISAILVYFAIIIIYIYIRHRKNKYARIPLIDCHMSSK